MKVILALQLCRLWHLSKMPFLASEDEQGNLLIDDNRQGKEKTGRQLDIAVVIAILLLLMF